MNLCHIMHPRGNDVADETGCLKKNAHNDSHICQDKDGRYWEWEDDYYCTCGCWDDPYDYSDVCGVYWELTEKEALEKINK